MVLCITSAMRAGHCTWCSTQASSHHSTIYNVTVTPSLLPRLQFIGCLVTYFDPLIRVIPFMADSCMIDTAM